MAVLCEGKHTVQAPACAAAVPFLYVPGSNCKISGNVWKGACRKGKTTLGVSDSGFNTVSQWTGCFVFFFLKNFFPRVLQFFLCLWQFSAFARLSVSNRVPHGVQRTHLHNTPRRQGCAATPPHSRGKQGSLGWMRNCKQISQVLGEHSDQGTNPAPSDKRLQKAELVTSFNILPPGRWEHDMPNTTPMHLVLQQEVVYSPSSSAAIIFKARPQGYRSGEAEQQWNGES